MSDNFFIAVLIPLGFSAFIFITFLTTAYNCDISVQKAELAQELCIKANSKAVSFDRTEVTCENNAIIPLKGD